MDSNLCLNVMVSYTLLLGGVTHVLSLQRLPSGGAGWPSWHGGWCKLVGTHYALFPPNHRLSGPLGTAETGK